jgi:hypothetical protein
MIEYPISTERITWKITWKITNILQLLIMQKSIRNIYQDRPDGTNFVDIGQVNKVTH